MKLVSLYNKGIAIAYVKIDDEDWQKVSKYNWHLRGKHPRPATRTRVGMKNRETKYLLLHRYIMNVTDRRLDVDHINHDVFDCQKSNLRVCTHAQNRANSISKKGNLKGVTHASKNRWRARIKVFYKSYELGLFNSPIDAAKAYNEAAKKYFGEFAYLNKI